jgi:hypothetical protein
MKYFWHNTSQGKRLEIFQIEEKDIIETNGPKIKIIIGNSIFDPTFFSFVLFKCINKPFYFSNENFAILSPITPYAQGGILFEVENKEEFLKGFGAGVYFTQVNLFDQGILNEEVLDVMNNSFIEHNKLNFKPND